MNEKFDAVESQPKRKFKAMQRSLQPQVDQ